MKNYVKLNEFKEDISDVEFVLIYRFFSTFERLF